VARLRDNDKSAFFAPIGSWRRRISRVVMRRVAGWRASPPTRRRPRRAGAN
jgi:hypothetical protein